MLFDWLPEGSLKLGCTSFSVLGKSIDITADSSWTVLIWLLTFCNRKTYKLNKPWEQNKWNQTSITRMLRLKTLNHYAKGTFSFWSSWRCDLSSPNFLTVRSHSLTCGSELLDWPLPAISAQIRTTCDWISENCLILSCFFDLNSSKIGFMADTCSLRVPLPFPNSEKWEQTQQKTCKIKYLLTNGMCRKIYRKHAADTKVINCQHIKTQ